MTNMQLKSLTPFLFDCKTHILDLSQPQVMGILNVTPDSFSDGGQYQTLHLAIQRAEQMISQGATIIDIGGESTRPNATVISLEEELKRVIPVVRSLRDYGVTLSVDTSHPQVIRQAVEAGAHIWNDVRALTREQAVETAIELDIPVILMHMRGEPQTMNQLAHYDNVVAEVKQALQQRLESVLAQGLKKERIILDVGFGFAKNTQHNIEILKHLSEFVDIGYPLLSGLSRKRFIGEILDIQQADERIIGSVIGHLLSIQQGANIVRVHDVKETVDAIKMWKMIYQSNK